MHLRTMDDRPSIASGPSPSHRVISSRLARGLDERRAAVELTPGTADGSMVTSPGARALAAGTGKVTLVNGSTTLVYTLTIE